MGNSRNIKPFNLKLKAGALQYTIFIAVVIALLVLAFISLTYTQQHFKGKTSNFLQTIHNTNAAVNYASNTQLAYNEIVKIKLLDNENDNTSIRKQHWGVFDLITATSTIKKETFTKNALLGGSLQKRPSLYLQDNNQPLVLVGDTRIEGNTLLPKQGVKRGTIAGNSYAGSQLIYGSTGLSKKNLPKLKNREYLKQLAQGSIQFANTIPLELSENTTILNSFNDPTQLFYSNTSIDLRMIKLTGNMIVQSSSVIKIYPSAQLIDILLIAPKIEILDAVKGNFQGFATKEISVGKNCQLGYPTSLILYEKKTGSLTIRNNNATEDWNHVQIASGTAIRGVVGFLSDNEINNYKPQISIDENSSITGEIYCNQNIELKGKITGSVFTKGFIANQFGSIYQNHIYNGKMVNTNFHEEYSGLNIENSTKNVTKWLY